jgi:4-hydroxy 2-oxovalerate aldolase
MDGVEVARIVRALRSQWDGPLGIHTHDNQGKGLDNTLIAKELGVTWLDSTVTGMGRGAGNTQTERLISVIDAQGKYNTKPIYELVIRYFEPMQRKFGWGVNLLYFLGAKNNVHPTYIQNLLSNTHYGTDEIIGAIDFLSELEGTESYNGAIFETALTFSNNERDISGSGDVQGLFDYKDILIVANSPSTEKYASAIEMYIEKTNPVVISINITTHISPKLISYYVISHNSKFLSEANKYKELDKPIIVPKHRFSDSELLELAHVNLVDHGLKVMKGYFTSSGTYTTIPYDVTSAYILGVLLESKVNKILVAGFDGYSHDDVRQQEMVDILNLYKCHQKSLEIISLTPTTHPIRKSSVYAPIK